MPALTPQESNLCPFQARLSDFRRDWPRPPRPNVLQKALSVVSSPAVSLWRQGAKGVRRLLNLPRPDQKVDEWCALTQSCLVVNINEEYEFDVSASGNRPVMVTLP